MTPKQRERIKSTKTMCLRLEYHGTSSKKKKYFKIRIKLYSLKNYFSPKWPLIVFIPYKALSSHHSDMVSYNIMSSLCLVLVLSGFNIFLYQQCSKCNSHHFLFSINSPIYSYTAHILGYLGNCLFLK